MAVDCATTAPDYSWPLHEPRRPEPVTLLRPDAPIADGRSASSVLPAELLDAIRARVRLLALLLFIAFAFDVTLYTLKAIAGPLGIPIPSPALGTGVFQAINVGAAALSAGLWWAARGTRVSPARLLTLGLIYEVAICFTIALLSYWQQYEDTHVIPYLTWVPGVVIFFPLVMPGPPRRMLAAAIAAGAMQPVALAVLDLMGRVSASPDAYVSATISSGFAVMFAFMGARIVYGLGREIAAARELGSYRLEDRLGAGGMGEVWRARHRMLARPAAIKLIRPSGQAGGLAVVSESARRRFEREAQAIADLRSPHTVDLFDFGVAADGTFYYVMELLDGLDADALVRRHGPVPAERAVYLLRQVCHSLSEAASRGLVHRDVKPANIFVCRYGEDADFVKVLDFGIVKATRDDDGGAGPTLTRENSVHGTPAFIAPEQALGGAALDGRADIYALGCVAYWLLTGQLVFTGDTPLAMVVHHARTPPVPPSSRTELPIPEALDRLTMACLEKDPAARPQTAKELSRQLGEIEFAVPWDDERAREWWKTTAGDPRVESNLEKRSPRSREGTKDR
jgi:serine/threonine-protein kinase